MSQSKPPKDNQALLQSMLQRLRLQSEGLGASTWVKDGARGDASLQNLNNSPTNGCEFGIPANMVGAAPVDTSDLKDEGRLQPVHGHEPNGSQVSVPSQIDTDSQRGENRVSEQVVSPAITLTETGQPVPVESQHNVHITSFKRIDGELQVETGNCGHTARNKDSSTNFKNHHQRSEGDVDEYSLTDCDEASQHNKVQQVENGGFGVLALSNDMHVVLNSQNKSTTSPSRRQQQSSENKTRRWTQKIKERWMEMPASFGEKKKKDKGKQEQRSEEGNNNQLLTSENQDNRTNMEGERTLPALDTGDSSETPPTLSEDATTEEYIRSSDDVFGLGSFSLLEEIISGQEWAKFLSPTLLATSANHEEPVSRLKITPNPYNGSESALIFKRTGNANSQWRMKCSKPSPASNFRPRISADAFLPVKETTEQDDHTDQTEPMEHAHGQLCLQHQENGQQLTIPSFIESANMLDNSVPKSNICSNRKRQHQLAEGRDERLHPERTDLSRSSSCSHMMDETGDSEHPPLLPPSSSASAPAPRGVLKHSLSQDSQSSMEMFTKRRRVELDRHVHFAEEVITIVPDELYLDTTDSEEDSGTDEEKQEQEMDEAAAEELTSTRRPVLPAWIRALKRRSTGKKHR